MNTRQKGFSLIELLIVVAIILIIAAIAVPSLLRSKMTANEASAVSSLHTLNTSAAGYATTYSGFPAALSNLGPGSPATSAAADLIDALLASGFKSGYSFTYSAGTPDSAGNISTYTLTAQPTQLGVTGLRYFYTDQSFVIRASSTATADVNSTPIS